MKTNEVSLYEYSTRVSVMDCFYWGANYNTDGMWSGEEVREWMQGQNKGWNENGTRSKLHWSLGGAEGMLKV